MRVCSSPFGRRRTEPTRGDAISLVEHPIRITGAAFEGRGVEPDVEHYFWRRLERSLIDAARITVYGASRKVGRSLKGLEDAWALRKQDEGPDAKRGGRTFLALLPRLGDAAPRLFEQGSLFGETLDPDDTVLDWTAAIAASVLDERTDSARLDTNLLTHLAGFRQPKGGFEAALIRPRTGGGGEVRFDETLGERAQGLVVKTPAAQRTRVKGTLNQMSYYERGLLLHLSGGSRLRVVWDGDDLDALRSLWGREVTVEGLLQFKPNGGPQALVADAIRAATPQDGFWDRLPEPFGVAAHPEGGLLRHGEIPPLRRLRGIFEGEMDDEELVRRIGEFSRA